MNVTIVVANQTRLIRDFEGKAASVCFTGFYGIAGTADTPGEYCLPCPEGGDCKGPNDLGQEPIAIPFFWKEEIANTSDGYFSVCPRERWNRTLCPLVVACQPQYACTGNNTCARGYTAIRCSECVKGKFYRCVACVGAHVSAMDTASLGGVSVSSLCVHSSC
jgi:hypothetical protein